jgi:phosphoribosyl 1,2-cyclic phosphate phosphodiesterase
MIETQGKVIVIDSGPDFRYQMLRAGVRHLDAIVFTHEHKDHVAGMDDVRAFNFKQQREIDVYAHPRVQEALKREFSYIFSAYRYPGVPRVILNSIDEQPFLVDGIEFIPIQVMHFKLPVLGFRIGDFTYITDAKTISPEERLKIKGSKIVVINALQKEDHISHLTLSEALAFAEDIGAPHTYLTHISHRLGRHADIMQELPSTVSLAYDGLVLNI